MLLSIGHPATSPTQGRHRQAAPVGRDARVDVGDLLRQDRHAHAQPDDGPPAGRRRAPLQRRRRGLLDRRAGSCTSPAASDGPLEPFLLPMALANDAVIRDGACIGDPTEGALVVLAAKGGLDVEETRRTLPPRRRGAVRRRVQADGDVPRDDDDGGAPVVRCFVKGAPDVLLARSSHVPRRRRVVGRRSTATPRPRARRERPAGRARACACSPSPGATSIRRRSTPAADLLALVQELAAARAHRHRRPAPQGGEGRDRARARTPASASG